MASVVDICAENGVQLLLRSDSAGRQICWLAPAKASADIAAFDASPMLAGSAFDVVESCHLLTKGNLALTPRCTIRGGYLRSRQAFMHLEFQLSWLISILIVLNK